MSRSVIFFIHVRCASPNQRNRAHWAQRAKWTKQERSAAWAAVYHLRDGPSPARIRLTLCGHRRRDDDNVVASLKHVRDGIATALLGGTPGEYDHLITWDYHQRPADKCVGVEVVLRW